MQQDDDNKQNYNVPMAQIKSNIYFKVQSILFLLSVVTILSNLVMS